LHGASRPCSFPSPGITLPGSYDDEDACPLDPKPPRLTLDEWDELDPDRDDELDLEYDDDPDDDRDPPDEPPEYDGDDRNIGRYAPRYAGRYPVRNGIGINPPPP
jgi:hypothetical protein